MARNNDITRTIDIAVGKKLQELRIAQGLSREQLAKKIDVSHQQLQKYEKGTNRVSIGRLVIMAAALGAPVRIFLEEVDTHVNLPDEKQRMCIEVARNFMKVKEPIHQVAIGQMVRALAN